MAADSTTDTIGLIATAKMSTEAVSEAIYLVRDQARKVSTDDKVFRTTIEPGESFYLPKLGTDTVTTLYSKTTTDGSSFSTTTNEGQTITATVIDDTPVQMQQKFEYTAMKYSKVAWNRMSINQRRMYVNGRITQGGRALASSMDSSVLSLANPGLQVSANQINAGAPANFQETDIASIYQIAETNNWVGHIWCVLHPDQIPYVDAIDRVRFHNVAGTGGGPQNMMRTYQDGVAMTIMFHNGVYDDETDGYHGMFWVQEAIGFQDVAAMNIDDWYERKEKTFYASPETDYVYAIQENTMCGTIQTPN